MVATATAGKRGLGALEEFLHSEASGGIVLVTGALIAVGWVDSPAAESYTSFWGQYLTLG